MDLLKWHKYNKEVAHKNQYELTPFLSKDKNAPVVIICPGGGYRMVASFIEGVPVAEFFQKNGFNAFVLRYRIKELAKYPHPMEDIAHALEDVMNIYKLSLDNYSLCGFSAGGHMCALFGTSEYGYKKYRLPKPRLLTLVYPVISLEKKITHRNTRKYFSNEEKDLVEIGNIYKHIDKDYPNVFIWRGDNDKSVPPINSDLLVEQLDKNNIEYKYFKYPKVGHGVGLGIKTSAEPWSNECINFWKNLIK